MWMVPIRWVWPCSISTSHHVTHSMLVVEWVLLEAEVWVLLGEGA